MQTLKTAVVVVLLLFVLYGGYVALNGTDTPLNPELRNLVDMEPDITGPTGPFVSTGTSSGGGFDSFANSPPPNFSNNSSPASLEAPSLGASTSSGSTSPFAAAFSSAPKDKSNEPSLPPLTLPSDFKPSESVPPTLAAAPPPVPKLSAPSGTSASPSKAPASALPPLPSFAPPNADDLKESSPSIPISTSTPSLDIKTPNPKVPAELTSSSTPALGAGSPNTQAFNEKSLQDESASLDEANAPTPAPESAIKSSTASKSFENAKSLAMDQVNKGNLKEALATMSVFYNAPELTSEQRHDLLDLLDALAREVVYSRRHFLDSVYVVAPGETLSEVSRRFNVPPEIIARINAIDSSMQLPSGAKLKVIPGPFRAEVDLTRGELTLFLGDLYAGRYPVTFGNDPAPKPGMFQVIDKQQGRNYYGTGFQIPKDDARNPYGGWWLDLGQDLCIHGSPENATDANKLGCISLSPMDAFDIYGMLGRGSPVTIRK